MTSVAIRNIAEAFFRHWLLYLAIFAGAVALGVLAVANSEDEYTASGSVFVDTQSLVSSEVGVRDSGGFSFLSPAQFTSQELNGLLSTEVFIEAALERAGVDLDPDPAAGRAQVVQLRESVGVSASSENLLAVTVTTADPELSSRVAGGVIEEFVRFKIDLDVTESGASEQFFADLVESYEQDLTEVRDAVSVSLRGVADFADLPFGRQLEVERLQQEEQLIEERYTSAVESLEASRLATLQTETDVRQRYSVFDPPSIPVEPNGGLFDDAMLVIAATVAGLGLALLATLVGAATNRAVTFADDISVEAVGTAVVAVLPRVKKRELALIGVVLDPAGDQTDLSQQLGQQTITIMPPKDSSESWTYAEAAEPSDASKTQTNGTGRKQAEAHTSPETDWSPSDISVTTEPVMTEPVATEPVATEPVATEAVATEPVAIQAVQPDVKAAATVQDSPEDGFAIVESAMGSDQRAVAKVAKNGSEEGKDGSVGEPSAVEFEVHDLADLADLNNSVETGDDEVVSQEMDGPAR